MLVKLLFIIASISFVDNWEGWYQTHELEEAHWYYQGLDPDIEAFLEGRGESVLDVGTGHGTQAIELAKRGYLVDAFDFSPSSVEKAAKVALAEGAPVHFFTADILDFESEKKYDIVIDRACLHCIGPWDHQRYVERVAALVKPGGTFFLKCYNTKLPQYKKPEEGGSCRFTEEDIYRLFSPYFKVKVLYDTVYQSKYEPLPPALFVVLEKNTLTGPG